MKLYIESENGHDTVNVPKGKEQEAVEGQLKDGKWVTLEKKSGKTEILTEKDIPDEDKELMDMAKWKDKGSKPSPSPAPKSSSPEWTSKFASVKSATATHKAKGG